MVEPGEDALIPSTVITIAFEFHCDKLFHSLLAITSMNINFLLKDTCTTTNGSQTMGTR